MGHILTKYKVLLPRFNTYFIKKFNSTQRAFIVWNLLSPDLAKTSNVQNCTRMASKSDNLRNLDFRAEFPPTMLHNNNDDFSYY